MDRLESMSLFVAVVDTGSLSATSRKLSVPLATLSRNISELEAHLGARLFQRSGRGLKLTETGASYAAACRRIIEKVADAEREAGGEFLAPKGNLTITAPIVFGRLHVLPIVTEFLKGHPDITIKLIQSDRLVDIPEEHVDVAIRIGRLPDSSLVARTVGAVRRLLCASPKYLKSMGTPQTPEDLMRHACISFETLAQSDSWVFQNAGKDTLVAVTPRLTVNTAEAAIDAAISGLGLTRVLSYQVKKAIADRKLVRVLDKYEGEEWPVSLIYPSRGPMPQKVRAFLDFAAARLKRQLAQG